MIPDPERAAADERTRRRLATAVMSWRAHEAMLEARLAATRRAREAAEIRAAEWEQATADTQP